MHGLFSQLKAVPAFIVAQREKLYSLAKFVSHKREMEAAKIIALSGGFLVFDRIVSNLFDYFLYPLVLFNLGILVGGVVMTFLSFLICYLWIFLFDSLDKNMFFIEDIKNMRNYHGNILIKRIMAWFVRKGDFTVFVVLCCKYDPFWVAVYFRKANITYRGLKGFRDWKIFLSAVLLGNLVWWVPAYYMGKFGISLLDELWSIMSDIYLFNILTSLLTSLYNLIGQAVLSYGYLVTTTLVFSITYFMFFSLLWYILVANAKRN